MDLEWDDEKRALTLTNRGLDFAHADKLFGGLTLTVEDDRFDYGETRFQTIGRTAARQSWWSGRLVAKHDASFR
jgi:uncharacterized DUF497 family protein